MFITKILAVFLVLLRIHGIVSQLLSTDEGPYKAVISNTSSCAQQLDWFQWNITKYTRKDNTTLRGTISFLRIIKDLKLSAVLYYLEGNKKTKVFDMKNQNCHNMVAEVILKTAKISFNDHTCRIKPGTYEFKDLKPDAIMHTVVQSLWYGTAQLRLKINERTATFMCLDIYLQIKQLQ